MSYPYPELLGLLEFRCTPDEYRQVVIPYREKDRNSHIAPHMIRQEGYWQLMRPQRYAQCPFCQRSFEEPADTYTLLGWEANFGKLAPYLYVQRVSCPHLLGVHRFINLHGQDILERDYFSNKTGEVPLITPWLFPTDRETYAILHALPICRAEEDQFVPRYTVFSLTYFTEDPGAFQARYLQNEWAQSGGDREFYPEFIAGMDQQNASSASPAYDLVPWAERGQLGWLDVADPLLPLYLGEGYALPHRYRRIQGSAAKYVYRKGQRKRF